MPPERRPSLAACAERGRAALVDAGWPREAARRDAGSLARHVLGWNAAAWLARAREPAPPGFADRFDALIARRVAHEPVAYLTGEREFYGRTFVVTPDVLIPRPETELVVEEALRCLERRERPARRRTPIVLDVGTGSGCLAVTLALERPDAHVVAVDVSDAALEVARENARRLGAGNRVDFRCGALLAGVAEPVDVVVANPPYVAEHERAALPREVVDYEPALALFAGPDGLDVIRALLPAARGALAPGGCLVMEIGLGQLDAVRDLVENTPALVYAAVLADLQGIPRVVSCRRTRRSPGDASSD